MKLPVRALLQNRHMPYVLAVCMFVFGFISAYAIWGMDSEGQFAIREYDDRFKFIRPLLICQLHEEEETKEYSSLEFQIYQLIAAAKKAGKIKSASVYFRDLNSGQWMGIDELVTYEPASLLKVPLMMTYFKEAENNAEILQTRYSYVRNAADDPLVKEPLLLPGRAYSVFDLIRAMIVQSDNDAKDILSHNANVSALNETYSVLGIKDPYTVSQQPYRISAKQYGLFFRVLYNSTFLNREMSNRALELLSESQFTLGLRAGTPKNVPIANKYGVLDLTEDDGSFGVELSDCGIIYNSSSPYLLCVMTHGKNPHVLSDVIKSVAETVYSAVATSDN